MSRSSANPKPLVTTPATTKGQNGSPYQSANAIGKSAASAEVLPERPDEVAAAATSIASRRGRPDPRAADSSARYSASTTQGAFAASVKMITRSPASRTSSPCGKIAVPLRTIAPMIEPCTGMSRNAMPM